MYFKPSAGIFVGGLATSFGGTLLILMAANSSGEDTGFMALAGVMAAIAGIIMLCIGAARALRIIDALPAAFRNLDRAQASQQQAPAPQQSMGSQPPGYPQQGYIQPPVQ
ncbi:hypothetical protein [Arthrobacter nitrophenolicus]|uniref:Uncharacterized protein n=2 Tax=Arthrobacter nitrophenolicus TaxID=683150 RepID=A0ACC6TH08_9MICC|nr:hypothetical protein [Arthrobacter nitrophenolicus]ELT44822.1 hypothetical protein G205_09028 [Arthrobacter nitrophenolicus]